MPQSSESPSEVASDVADAIMNGDGLPFLDDTHVVITLTDGKKALLNTDDGTTSPLAKGEVYWCEKDPDFKVNAPKGFSDEASRTSTSLYFGCTASGEASTKVPKTTPASVGITIDGMFAWPAPGGLRTRAIGAPATFA